MKKLALSSLIAVFAVSAANAGVVAGSPLYMPQAHHFYSVTDLKSQTSNVDVVSIGENFNYGITDWLMVGVNTSVSQQDWFDKTSWDTLGVKLTARVFDDGAWKADVYGSYGMIKGLLPDHGRFMDKDKTEYRWVAGVRGGYVGNGWIVAGHFEHAYDNLESFKWNDDNMVGERRIYAGVDGQLILNDNWSLIGGAEYQKQIGRGEYSNPNNPGAWLLTFGTNYNIDETKYIGVYLTKEAKHTRTPETGTWELTDGFGGSVKFGIDF